MNDIATKDEWIDEEAQVWIEAAVASLKAVGSDASERSPDQATVKLAQLIEEMASMDPRERTGFADDYDGATKAAMLDWIADSYDEGDIERWVQIDAQSGAAPSD